MKSTLYSSLLNRLKNKHSKLATRFHKSVKDGEFQKQRYRKRKESVERLKSLEKRIKGLSQESGLSVSINYKHWAAALALGAVVATSNPVQAQEVQLSQSTIIGNAYPTNVLRGDIDNDGNLDLIYLSYVDDPIVLTNEGGFSFSQAAIPNTAGIVNLAVLGDMDGDGSLDIFMKNGTEYDGYTYQVWLNDGAGNFSSQPATLPAIDFDDDKIFVGDLDNDGNADLVVEENGTYQYVRTLINDGSFNFGSGNSYQGPFFNYTYPMALFDVDGDTDLDMVYRSYYSGGQPFLVLDNDGAGAFTQLTGSGYYTTIPYTLYNNTVASIDIDGDAFTDMVAVTNISGGVGVQPFINDGSDVFTFSSAPNIPVYDASSQYFDDIFGGDLGTDSFGDLVLNSEDSTFVLSGDGAGGFATIAKFDGTALPGDLDNDGDDDLFFVKEGNLLTKENDGTNTFPDRSNLLAISSVYSLDTVDIDGDGHLDIATAGPEQSRIWLNDGLGNFSISQELGPNGKSVVFGNLDADADLEMILGRQGDYYNNNLGFEIWDNSGGILSVVDTIGYGNWAGKQVFIENIDADADLEILVFARYEGDGSNNRLRSFDNLGGLNFSEISVFPNQYMKYEAISMDVGDIDGDTNIDVVVASGDYSFAETEIFTNNGDGTFATPTGFQASNSFETTSAKLADFDGDGDLDLFTNSASEHKIWLNTTGTFAVLDTLGIDDYSYQSSVGDIDGDGDNDIILGGYLTYPKIFLNDGMDPPAFTQDADVPAIADEYSKTIIADIDNDGDNDILFSGYYTGLKAFFNQALAPEPDINVQGNGIDIASGDTTPETGDHTDFGSVVLGESSQTTFTIQNIGATDLDITDIVIGGTHASDFSLTVIPSIVSGGSAETFDVTFEPIASGARSAEIQITSDDPDEGTYTFSIGGTGQAEPEINIQGNGLDIITGDNTPDVTDGTDFGTVVAGSTSTTTFRIQNNGTSELNLTSIEISGANASDFAISGITTPTTITDGSELTFDVDFNPTVPGSSIATVTLENDDSDEGTYTFDIAGTAVSPEINITGNGEDILTGDDTPDLVDGTDFGVGIIGNTPTKSTFIIENNGDSELNINSILLSGTGGGEFELFSETTPFAIAIGETSSFEVDFNPANSGVADASVDIASDDLDEGTYSFSITGFGQTAQEINVQGNDIDIASGDNTPDITDGTSFGSLAIGEQSTAQFTIQNIGETDLEVSDIQLTGTNPEDFSIGGITLPNTIAGNSSTTFDVTFTSSAIATSTAIVEITSDDSDEVTYSFDISASGKAPGVFEADSLALVEIYNSTGGDSWTNNTNWLIDGQRVDNWHGVTVVDSRVTSLRLDDDGTLNFNGNNLVGTIPPDIGDLTQLETLSLASNQLSGEIPTSIGDLINLINLYLSQNQLSGEIPEEIGSLSALEELTLFENNLTGEIPPALGDLTNLRILFLGDNELSGAIPSFLLNLVEMVRFDVRNNSLTGTISEDFGNWANLTEFGIQNNGFEGELPEGFSSLESLEFVSISENSFTSIPDFSGISTITTLDVSRNLLDFEDLEPNASVNGLIYTPQNEVVISLELSIDGGTPFEASDIVIPAENPVEITGITGVATNNVYDWTLNESVVSEQTEITYSIPSIGRDDMGDYQLFVSNSLLPDLTFISDPVEILASAIISVSALDEDSESPIPENVNGYIFSLNEEVADTVRFDGVPGVFNVSPTFSFPEVILGDYLVAVESTVPISDENGDQNPDATYIPTFYGDAFLSIESDTLFLDRDESIDIEMEEFPEVEVGEGVVGGTIEEDFGDEESRVAARRAAKKRKCGLRRRRTGGRIGQDDADEFELIAYGETNDNGEFEYGFLPEGTYRFFVEYPGIPLDESAFVEFEIGEAGVTDDTFVLAVFASPDGIEIEIVLGITSDYFTDFSIYPNPTSDVLNIEYSEIKEEKIMMEVISVEGKVLHSQELNRSRNKIQYDTSLLPSGQYLLRFSGNSGKEHLIYRIVKK